MRVYFDNAATTPLSKEATEAMLPYMQTHFGNPSAIHFYGRETRTAIEKARKTVAKLLNCSTSEIFFTSGGTESSNTAIRCGIDSLGIRHAITSPVEHHAVLHPLEALEKEGKIKLHYVIVDEKGRFNLQHLRELLQQTGEKTFVSLMHANNEIGTMADIDEVAAVCKEFDAVFHSDTVQSMAHYRFDLQQTSVHFLQGSAHKFHGPKGAGFIYINQSVKIHPFIYGGAQERNMRAGTENVYGIVGLAKAMERAYERLDQTQSHTEELRSYMIQQLKKEFPEVAFNGDYEGRYLYTVLNVSFPRNEKTELLLFNLDIAGICVSSGSACSSGSNKSSHVLSATGAGENKVSIRFSFSEYNTKEEVDYTIGKLKELVPASHGMEV